MKERAPQPAAKEAQPTKRADSPWQIVHNRAYEAAVVKVAITNKGEVAVFVSPIATVDAPSTDPKPEVPVQLEPVPAPTPQPEPSLPAQAAPEQEKAPRATLTGRVGALPTFRESKTGRLIAQFPFATHPNGEDQTVWQTILFFQERAQKLKQAVESGSFQKGQEWVITGYPHTREVPQPDGSTKLADEVYAVAISDPAKPKNTKQPSPKRRA